MWAAALAHCGHMEMDARPGLLNMVSLEKQNTGFYVKYDFQMLATNSFKNNWAPPVCISSSASHFLMHRQRRHHHRRGKNDSEYGCCSLPPSDSVFIGKPGWPGGMWDVWDARRNRSSRHFCGRAAGRGVTAQWLWSFSYARWVTSRAGVHSTVVNSSGWTLVIG